MATDVNYLLIWFVYLTASVVFYSIFWRATAFQHAKWLSYSLRAVSAAVILTPWYANVQGESMAPALMVMSLDLITIGFESMARTAIPLVLSILVAEIVASAIYLIQKHFLR